MFIGDRCKTDAISWGCRLKDNDSDAIDPDGYCGIVGINHLASGRSRTPRNRSDPAVRNEFFALLKRLIKNPN